MPRFSTLPALAALLFCTPIARADAPVTTAMRAASGVMPFSTRAFRAMGLLGPHASVVRERVLAPVAPRKSVQSTRTAAADGSLLFDYKGYTPAQKQVLSDFISKNYSSMVNRYGAPSPEQRRNGGKTIEVVGNSGIADAYQPLLKPVDSNRGDGGSIYFQYVDYGDKNYSTQINQFNFTRLVLRAFQGPNNFSYDYIPGKYDDAYQSGLADAAALLVLYDSLSATQKATFDPKNYDSFLLHVYDLFNRPELSSAYILPALDNASPDTGSILPEIRLDMAQAAWLKVAIEHPTFFKDFNTAYYAKIPARQAATSAQLRAIAAEVAPQVEGLSFNDWARRQYVLDNSVTTGSKLLALIVPIQTPSGTSQETGFQGFAEAFATGADGRDTRLTGFGSIDALDENGVNINIQSRELSASNLLQLKNVPLSFDFGAGFLNMAAPNRARITIKLSFKGLQTSVPFPYIGTSGAASQSTIYGITQQGSSGDLGLSNNTGSEALAISRGAFAGTKTYVPGPAVITQLTLGGRVFKRNTAWLPAGSRGIAFVLEGGATNSAFTLKTAAGASTVRMISLPIFPVQSDESDILGIAAKDLKFARYRPNLVPGTITDSTLTFGIGADRHEIYPNISTPIAPGRGYWLGAGEITRTVQGSEPRADQPFEVELAGGWNQFGVPFNKNFSPAAIQVRYGSFAPVSLADAVKNGLVAPGIWRWQGGGGYARADLAAGATLPPFEGFYIYAAPARGVSLVFNPSATPAAISARSQSAWSLPLVASSGETRDASNQFGVAEAGAKHLAAAKPPTGPLAVTLHFASSGDAGDDAGGAGAASGWADSFLTGFGRTGVWKFSVDGTVQGTNAALSWGDLKTLPAEITLALRDEKLGKVVAMRAGGAYSWSGDGAARAFTLTATRRAQASLQVTAAPSRGVEIAVGMSWLAHGRLEIQTPAGDIVTVLKSGDFAARTEKFTWNGARRDGQSAAAGRYRAVWTPTLATDLGASYPFDWRP